MASVDDLFNQVANEMKGAPKPGAAPSKAPSQPASDIPDWRIWQSSGAGTGSAPSDISPGGFAGNFIKSGANFLSGLGHAVAHPIDTATSLAQTVAGELPDAVTQPFARAMQSAHLPQLQTGGQILAQAPQVAKAVNQFYKERYFASPTAPLKTLYNDPVGLLGDAASAFDAGGGLLGAVTKASKAAEAAGVAKAATIARVAATAAKGAKTLGEWTNPLSAVTAPAKFIGGTLGGAIPSRLNPVQKAANEYAAATPGLAETQDAATATGSRYLQNMKTLLRNIPGSGADDSIFAQQQAIGQHLDSLHPTLAPGAVRTGDAAGTIGQDAVNAKLKAYTDAASEQGYDPLRQFARDNPTAVRTGWKPMLGPDGQPLMQGGKPILVPETAPIIPQQVQVGWKPMTRADGTPVLKPDGTQAMVADMRLQGPTSIGTGYMTPKLNAAGRPIMEGGTPVRQAVMTDMAGPVKYKEFRDALAPQANDLLGQPGNPALPGAMAPESPTAAYLARIRNRPDYVPLATALFDLQSMRDLRLAAKPIEGTSTYAASVGRAGLNPLRNAIGETAAALGPEAEAMLNTGEEFSRQKGSLARAVPGSLRKADNPNLLTDRVLRPENAGLKTLKALQTHTPEVVPQMRGALLGDLVDPIRQGGGVDKIQTSINRFNNLGQET